MVKSPMFTANKGHVDARSPAMGEIVEGPQPNRFTKQRLELCLESEILST